MSDIAKNLFEKNKTKYLEGDSSVEELNLIPSSFDIRFNLSFKNFKNLLF